MSSYDAISADDSLLKVCFSIEVFCLNFLKCIYVLEITPNRKVAQICESYPTAGAAVYESSTVNGVPTF